MRKTKTRKKPDYQDLLALWLGGLILALGWLPCVPAAYQIETIAGNGIAGDSGDNGQAIDAQFHHARGLAVDSAGQIYIADTENHRVRKINVVTGIITTVAGGGNLPFGEGKKATEIQLNMPINVEIDNADHLYILDHADYRVYKVDMMGIITLVAGNGNRGYSGDGGLATEAEIDPLFGGISLDNKGNLYIADRRNYRIRKVDSKGIISTIAGNGEQGHKGDGGKAIAAQLNLPEDIVVDNDGNLYIADSYNHIIRKVDTHNIITTIAGIPGKKGDSGDGGLATEATFGLPIGVAVDNEGNLFIADFKNNRIRKIDKQGIIMTVAGNGKVGYDKDSWLAWFTEFRFATLTSLNYPEDIALGNKNGDSTILYVNDKDNIRIRKLKWYPDAKIINRYFLFILSVLGLTLFIGMNLALLYYLRLYRHPIVQALSADSSQLLEIPLEQLSGTQYLLQRTHRLDTVLANNGASLKWLENAINFATLSNAERCAWLATRLMAEKMGTDHADIFELLLNETFPLRLESCLVYFPVADSTEVMSLLKKEMSLQVTVVISLEPTQQATLRPMGENRANLWVVPNQRELTTLLLSPQPIEVFARLLASQLKVTHISPYQTQRGVTKDSGFFGRENILAQMLYSEPKNYVIVGGRKAGKSSLLKKIERHYRNDPKVDCLYVCLACDNLLPLYGKLGLPPETALPTLYGKLAEVPTGQRRLLLLDEADLFIREEIANRYTTLKEFRALSENGQCYFVIAGFWYLYEIAVSAYYSPLNNFGESIKIGALEYEACQDLATKPMTLLGIRYASKDLVEQIITAMGQRANLVAIACDEMVKQLPSHRRMLNQKNIRDAFDSDRMREALGGWLQLSDDDQIDRLARIIVYARIEAGEFSLTDVMGVLNAHDYVYTTVQLNKSLECLELAYIIRCETDEKGKNRYRYCVPLFREWLLRQEVGALLEQEFRS